MRFFNHPSSPVEFGQKFNDDNDDGGGEQGYVQLVLLDLKKLDKTPAHSNWGKKWTRRKTYSIASSSCVAQKLVGGD